MRLFLSISEKKSYHHQIAVIRANDSDWQTRSGNFGIGARSRLRDARKDTRTCFKLLDAQRENKVSELKAVAYRYREEAEAMIAGPMHPEQKALFSAE